MTKRLFSLLLFALLLAMSGLAFLGSPVAAVVPAGDTIEVRVRGTTGTEDVALSINDEIVIRWSNVSTEQTSYSYQVAESAVIRDLKVHFLNDGRHNGIDRNVEVDGVTVGDSILQSEDPANLSLGRWTLSNGCGEGHKHTEVLHCNGWISYAAAVGIELHGPSAEGDGGQDSVEDPSQVPAPTGRQSSIVVHAAGAQGTETMELRINDQTAAQWSNIGRSAGAYEYHAEQATTVDRLSVHFTNDGGWPAADKNLFVDRIVVDGISFESEASDTSSNGSWSSATGCNAGVKRSEWLHCGDAWFDYQATSGIQLAGAGTVDQVEEEDGVEEEDEVEDDGVEEEDNVEEDGDVDQVDDGGNAPGAPVDRIAVRARGTTGTEQLELSINGERVTTWNGVSTEFADYVYEVTSPAIIDELLVHFTNDARSNGLDRNVVIDHVVVGDRLFESEEGANRSLGRWTASNGCGEGRKQTEVLHCNGWISYAGAAGIELGGETSSGEQPAPDTKILVMTKTSVFAHPSIAEGISMLDTLAAANNFSVTYTEDSSIFEDTAAVAEYDAVLFLNTDSVVFENDVEKQNFRTFIDSGRGFIGIHGAAATHWNQDKWDWYRDLVGQRFVDHPIGPRQLATIQVVDGSQPSTAHLEPTWQVRDEWYNFEAQPSAVDVLLTVDEATYDGGTMGSPHPIAWSHTFGPGASRVWYTNLGHEPALYSDATYIEHVLGGISWVLAAS